MAVALIALAGAGALILLFASSEPTEVVRTRLLRIAGWGAMSVPVAMLWAGVMMLTSKFQPGLKGQRLSLLGACLLALSLIGLMQLAPVGEKDLALRVELGQGGGRLGYLVANLILLNNIGVGGTVLVLLGCLAAGSMLVWRVTPGMVVAFARERWMAFQRWRKERAITVAINTGHETLPARREPAPSRGPSLPRKPDAPAPEEAEESAPAVAGAREWTLPPVSIFESIPEVELSQVDIRQRIKVIEETLRSFGVEARVVEVNQGPAVTQFGVEPGVGVKVARILALGNDLALRLAAAPLRLEAPVPGKQVVGIEVPNGTVAMVSIRDMLESPQYVKHKGRLRMALGRDVSGNPVVSDLTKMPHLLIAGATGSGKSVCVNSFIAALLYQNSPEELRMIMIDPKMVEMVPFNGIPHLLTPVVTEMDKVVPALKWVVMEMERRYRMFAARGCRNVEAFNRAASGKGTDLRLPFIVVIIDELADLMMVAPDEVERIICRLAQLARATGIHLVVATQRPSVDVVTGLIKANFPTRISFTVTSQVDSRTILDQGGAEKLLGRGDMLFLPSDVPKPMRLQGTYVSDGEILDLVSFWHNARPAAGAEGSPEAVSFEPVVEEEGDDLYEQAVEMVSTHNRVSTSLLQRRLRIGYNRAARLMELLEEEGIVAPAENGKSREVLVRSESGGEDDPDGL